MNETVYAAQVMESAGITYRQLDNWCRTGLACPVDTDPGVGHARRFTRAELRVLTCMGRLVAAGMRPAAAHTIARGDKDAAEALIAAVGLATGGAA